MMADEGTKETAHTTDDVAKPPITLGKFLTTSPPSPEVVEVKLILKRIARARLSGRPATLWLTPPRLRLHCPNPNCDEVRPYDYVGKAVPIVEGIEGKARINAFLSYRCSDCRRHSKIYALQITFKPDTDSIAFCRKLGEDPPYGEPTPTRLLRLFGKERDTFQKGRRCENHGLGIGAFAYYRRVVEAQKQRLFDEIIRVAVLVKAEPKMIETLRAARDETQFSKSLEAVKDAIPDALFIYEQNPMTLLHTALSDGLHGRTDARCLVLAQGVRIVLVRLIERIDEIQKDDNELKTAVSELMHAKRDGSKLESDD